MWKDVQVDSRRLSHRRCPGGLNDGATKGRLVLVGVSTFVGLFLNNEKDKVGLRVLLP